MGKCDRTEWYELTVVNWEKLSQAFVQILSVPPSLEIRILLSSGG